MPLLYEVPSIITIKNAMEDLSKCSVRVDINQCLFKFTESLLMFVHRDKNEFLHYTWRLHLQAPV